MADGATSQPTNVEALPGRVSNGRTRDYAPEQPTSGQPQYDRSSRREAIFGGGRTAQPAEAQPQRTYEQPQRNYQAPQRTYEQPRRQAPQRTYEAPQRTYETPQRSSWGGGGGRSGGGSSGGGGGRRGGR